MAYGYEVPRIDDPGGDTGADVTSKMMANLAMMIIPTFLKQSWADAREARRDTTKVERAGAEAATILALNSTDSDFLIEELNSINTQLAEAEPGSYDYEYLEGNKKRFENQIRIVQDLERKDEIVGAKAAWAPLYKVAVHDDNNQNVREARDEIQQGLNSLKMQVVSDQIDDLIRSNPEAAEKLMEDVAGPHGKAHIEEYGKAELHKKYMEELNKAIKSGDLNSILSIDENSTEDDINLKAYEITSIGALNSYIKALDGQERANLVTDDVAKSLLAFEVSVRDKIGTYVEVDTDGDGVPDDRVPWVKTEGAQTLQKDLHDKLGSYGDDVTARNRAEAQKIIATIKNGEAAFNAIESINETLEGGHLWSPEATQKAKDAKFLLYQGVGNDDLTFLRKGLEGYNKIWDLEKDWRNDRIREVHNFASDKASYLHRMASELEDKFGMGQATMAQFDDIHTQGGRYSLRMDINTLFAKDKRELTPQNLALSKIAMATEMSKLFEPSSKKNLKEVDRIFLKKRARQLIDKDVKGGQPELENIAREFINKLAEVRITSGSFNFDYEGWNEEDDNAKDMFEMYFNIYQEIKNADMELQKYMSAGFNPNQGLIGNNVNNIFPQQILHNVHTFDYDAFMNKTTP